MTNAEDRINEWPEDVRPVIRTLEEIRLRLHVLDDMENFHPRAVKLMRKHKPFVVVAYDEPYYKTVYDMIRVHEIEMGRWTKQDEAIYLKAVG